MKIMKSIGCFLLALGFFQCASMQFEKKPPFTIEGASYNKYFGGMPGVSGTKVNIRYNSTQNINFDSIYFQGRKTKIELKSVKNKTYISGNFNTSTVNSKEDLILHRDGKKEMVNKLPTKKIPFELKENEAVISYTENNKSKYFKIENLKESKAEYYP